MPEFKVFPYVLHAEQFGSDVRANRIRCEMSQSFLGAFLGYTGSYVSALERGRAPSISVRDFLALCNLFDLDPRKYFIIGDIQ